MSRYTIEDLYNSTYHVKGPDGLVGALYFKGDPEAERFKRYIEAHDEVMAVLREALDVVRDWATTEAYEQIEPKVEALLARIEGEEER